MRMESRRMNKKERRQIIFKIGDILENTCKACEHNVKSGNKRNNICLTSCSTGKELQRLGNLLETKKPMEEPKGEKEVKKIREISKEEIVALKEQGKSDPEVMEILGISHVKLNELKQKYDLIGKYPRVFKPRKEKPEKKLRDLNNEMVEELEKVKSERDAYKQENETVKELLNDAKTRIAQLQGLIDELADEKDNLVAACEDLENEVDKYKLEKKLAGIKDNDIREEEENKLLRQLLKVVL
jgi:hypothetical protein